MKLLGENKTEVVMQRLEQLEARATSAQTLELCMDL